METRLSKFRRQYPAYDNRGDDDLLRALHAKDYSEQIDYDMFAERMRETLPDMDEGGVNPETGQPWTPDEIDATKINPSTPAGIRMAAEAEANRKQEEARLAEEDTHLQGGDVGKTLGAHAAKSLVAGPLHNMEASRREWSQSVIEERVGIEGEENRERITQETTDRVNKYGTGTFYDAFIRPYFGNDDETAGQRVNTWADAKLRTRSEVAEKKGAKPFLNSNAEWYTPFGRDGWFDGDSVFSDPEAFLLKIAENAPQIGVSIGAGVFGGKGGALMRLRGLTMKQRTNPALVREAVGKGGAAGGMVSGTATEAVLIRDAATNETRDRILDLPEETWEENNEYLSLREQVGETRAKQMIADEKARIAGTTAMIFSAPLGAPAGALFGRIGAGVASKQAATGILSKIGQITGSVAKTTAVEAATEGPQEVIENLATNVAVSRVDPNQAWTEGGLNAFLGGAAIGGTMALATSGAGALIPETGVTKDSRELMADEKTRNFLTAAKDTEKLMSKMSDPDQIAKMSIPERLKNYEEMERLEEIEAKLMLKAEPGLRRSILKRQTNDQDTARAVVLLDTLHAKSKTTIKQIETMRQARQSEDEFASQIEQQTVERAKVSARVEGDMATMSQYERLVGTIEEVQGGGILQDEQYEMLVERGYGRWSKNKSEFVITKRGKEAVPELQRDIDQISDKMETGYVGPERRKDLARRERVEGMNTEELETEVYRDSNTKIKNKRAYDTDEEVEPSAAVAVVDADSLKWVNDNLGEEKGNHLLRKIARALSSEAGGRAYHLHGDEFAVTGDSVEEVERIMQGVAKKLAELRPIRSAANDSVVVPMDKLDTLLDAVDKVVEKQRSSGEGFETQPTITWGTGETLEQADKEMRTRKRIRGEQGKRGVREAPPPNLTVISLDEARDAKDAKEKPTQLNLLSLKRFGARYSRATKNEMRRARRIVYSITEGFANMPKGFIKIVNTVNDLPKHMHRQLRAMGTSMNGVVGMFDERNPKNGIYIVVANNKPGASGGIGTIFERNIAEVVMHELVGHYGLRGLIGSQSGLDQLMDAVMVSFPELTHRKAKQYNELKTFYVHRMKVQKEKGVKDFYKATEATKEAIEKEAMSRAFKDVSQPTQRIMAEEVVADMAGKILSHKVTLDPQQKGLFQKIMAAIRQWMITHGMARYVKGPMRFKDADLLSMIERQLDFVRHSKSWNFERDNGQSLTPYLFMRDSEIYISSLQSVFTESKPVTKHEAKSRGVPKGTLVPVLKPKNTPAKHLNALKQLLNAGAFSSDEFNGTSVEDWLTDMSWADLMEGGAMEYSVLRNEIRRFDRDLAAKLVAMTAMMDDPAVSNENFVIAESAFYQMIKSPLPKSYLMDKEVIAKFVNNHNLRFVVNPQATWRVDEGIMRAYVNTLNPAMSDSEKNAEIKRLTDDMRDPNIGVVLPSGVHFVPGSNATASVYMNGLHRDGGAIESVVFNPKSREIKITIDRSRITTDAWFNSPMVRLTGEVYFGAEKATGALTDNIFMGGLPAMAAIKKLTDNTLTIVPEAVGEWFQRGLDEYLKGTEESESRDAMLTALNENNETPDINIEMQLDGFSATNLPMVGTATKFQDYRSQSTKLRFYDEFLIRAQYGDGRELYTNTDHWSGPAAKGHLAHVRVMAVTDASPHPDNHPDVANLAYMMGEYQQDWGQQYWGKQWTEGQELRVDADLRYMKDMLNAVNERLVETIITAHEGITYQLTKALISDPNESDAHKIEHLASRMREEFRALHLELLASVPIMFKGISTPENPTSVTAWENLAEGRVPGNDLRVMDLYSAKALQHFVQSNLSSLYQYAQEVMVTENDRGKREDWVTDQLSEGNSQAPEAYATYLNDKVMNSWFSYVKYQEQSSSLRIPYDSKIVLDLFDRVFSNIGIDLDSKSFRKQIQGVLTDQSNIVSHSVSLDVNKEALQAVPLLQRLEMMKSVYRSLPASLKSGATLQIRTINDGNDLLHVLEFSGDDNKLEQFRNAMPSAVAEAVGFVKAGMEELHVLERTQVANALEQNEKAKAFRENHTSMVEPSYEDTWQYDSDRGDLHLEDSWEEQEQDSSYFMRFAESWDSYYNERISDEVDSYWENIDWDDHEFRDEPLNEDHSAYIAIDDAQDEEAADEWLNQAREQYKRDNEHVADEVSAENLREQYDEEAPVVYHRQLEFADEDGESEYHDAFIFRKAPNAEWDTYMGDDELYSGDGSSDRAFRDFHDMVKDWMATNQLRPVSLENSAVDKQYADGWNNTESATGTPQEVPVPEVTAPDPDTLDPDAITKSVLSNLHYDAGEPISNKKAFERYAAAWRTKQTRQSHGVPRPPVSEKKTYEAALKFMISDAVRKGFRRIMWHGGEANIARGGLSEVFIEFEQIEWAPMSYVRPNGEQIKAIRVEGLDQEGRNLTYFFRETDVATHLGHEVWMMMQDQMSGTSLSMLPESEGIGAYRQKGKSKPEMSDLDMRQTSDGGSWIATHPRQSTEVIAVAATKKLLEKKIAPILKDAQENGNWPWEQRQTDLPSADEPTINGQYVISKGSLGKMIKLIQMGEANDYSPTVSPNMSTRMMGARMAYGPKLESNFNAVLKQWGAKIGEVSRVMTAADINKKIPYLRHEDLSNLTDRAILELSAKTEGYRIITDPTYGYVNKTFGALYIVAVKANGPYMIESENTGLLSNELLPTMEHAKDAMDRWLLEVQNNVDVKEEDGQLIVAGRGFDITDEMVELAENGWAVMSYLPYKDPVLMAAAERIGGTKTTLQKRYEDMSYRWQDKFNQGMFDRFHGIKAAMRRTGMGNPDAAVNPYIQARLTTSLDAVMKAALEYGHPVWDEGIVQTEGKGLLDILQPVSKQLDLWGMYMAGVRAKRLMEEGRERNFTPEMIEKMVALGEQFPIFKDVAAEYAAYNKAVLDFAEQAGVINPETRAMWENADYVPFYRVQDDRLVGPLGRGKGIADQSSPVKRLKGGEDPIGDIVHNIMMNTTQLIDSAMKNHAAKMAVDMLDGTGLVQKMPYQFTSQLVPMKQINKVLVQNGMDPDTIPEEALKGFQTLFALQPPKGDGVISIMRDGKKEFYYTDDTLLYESMTAINQKQWGLWMRLLRKPKRLLTTMVTLDPGFMVRNFIRDLVSAFVIGRNAYEPFSGAVRGFKEAMMKDESMRTMMSAGAAFDNGYINAFDPSATQRAIKAKMKTRGIDASTVLNTPRKLFEAWKALGAASENANRIAQYHAAIRAGKSKAQAVFESKDLMDFSMGGSWAPIQILIQTVPFMGARLQGLHRLGRGAAEQPVSFLMKGMIVGMAGLALWFQFKDDERYKELEEWEKDIYFHWWIGEEHYRLPKPFEVGAVFNTIPERAFEFIYNQENDAGKLLLKRFGFMLGETFNFNPVPQAIMPMVESTFNHSFFTGRQITSTFEQQKMGPEQYRYYNSPTMIELAKHLPEWMDKMSDPRGKMRSPRHLQHVFSGYFGTLGKYMLLGADSLVRQAMSYPAPPEKNIADLPVVGSFFRGTKQRRTKYENEFYELLNKTLQVKNSMSFLNKIEEDERLEMLEEKYEPYINVARELEKLRTQLSKKSRQQMEIYLDPSLTPKQKRTEIDEIQRERNEMFRDAWGLRPGGRDNPIHDPTKEDVSFLLDRFGVDELKSVLQKKGIPATASLVDDVMGMGRRQASTLNQ